MSRGQPDYGNPDYAISQVSFDPSTLLTAIKGVNSVDGKGRVWKIENFADGFGSWATDIGGDATDPFLSASIPEIGGVSLEMPPGTLSGSGESIVSQILVMTVPVRLGVEAGFYFDPNAPDYVIIIEYRKTGGTFQAGVNVSEANRTITVQTPSGWQTVATLDSQNFTAGWFPIKLVVDFTATDYVRIVYGGTNLDVSGYTPLTSMADGIGTLNVYISALASSDTNVNGFVGHTIITLDEP